MLRGFLPPISNRQSFVDDIQLVDPDDGSFWGLADITMKLQLERVGDCYTPSDYAPYASYGTFPAAALLATTENGGIAVDGNLSFNFALTASQMATLSPGQYRLSAVITRDGESLQLFQFDVPILDGGVPQ